MAKRVCAEPGCPTLVTTGRCPAHRTPSPTTHRSWAERQRRANTVDNWVRLHGYLCPGWGRPAHESHDLTADHVTPVSRGGGDGPLQVLCRACNSRRGTKTSPDA